MRAGVFGDRLNQLIFRAVHGHNLVYNTCWEDPRLDRIALQLQPHDRLVAITSAGCNVLDYLLDGPEQIVAVDMNPRQNALLELKLAAMRHLEFEDFFAMFGRGYWPGILPAYRHRLRRDLSPTARDYWDRWIGFFASSTVPFFYRGTAGALARFIRWYAHRVLGLQQWLDTILAASNLGEQQEIYEQHLRQRFWTPFMTRVMESDAILSLLGVPRAQRQQVEESHPGGIVRFVQEAVDAVFAQLPLQDNYFWRVYLTGRYSSSCCPEYLKPDNFHRLKHNLIDRVSIHCATLTDYLVTAQQQFSRYVLLDHMDWLAAKNSRALADEWQAILHASQPAARYLWRSGGLSTPFVDRLRLMGQGGSFELGERLHYHRSLAEHLHRQDRVHTYGSFHVAELAG